MNYSREENAIGLARIAEVMRADERTALFATYCEQREKGLKKPALRSLNAFIAEYKTWPLPSQREWLNRIMKMHLANPDVRHLLPHPLKQAFVIVLREWVEADLSEPAPCRWLGVLLHSEPNEADPERWFEQAIARDLHDDYSRLRWAHSYVRAAEFWCHHIPEGLIDTPEQTRSALHEAEAILAPIAHTERGQAMQKAITDLRNLLSDWLAFQASKHTDFNTWCTEEKGRAWSMPSVYSFSTE